MLRSTLPSCLSWSIAIAATACLAQESPFPKPGPEHAALQKLEGTWDVVISVPRVPKSKGVVTCKMECGGLWLVRDLTSNFAGLALTTKAFDGYDPLKGKYVSVQVDSLTTVPMFLEGTYDESTKTLTQTGEARDFDGSPEKIKSVTRYVDDDHHIVEVYRVYPDGKEAKHLTIEHTRRAGGEPAPRKE